MTDSAPDNLQPVWISHTIWSGESILDDNYSPLPLATHAALPPCMPVPAMVPTETAARWREAQAAWRQASEEIKAARLINAEQNDAVLAAYYDQAEQYQAKQDVLNAEERAVRDAAAAEIWGDATYREVIRRREDVGVDQGSTYHQQTCTILNSIQEPSYVSFVPYRYDEIMTHVLKRTDGKAKVCGRCAPELKKRIAAYSTSGIASTEALALEAEGVTLDQLETLTALNSHGTSRNNALLYA